MRQREGGNMWCDDFLRTEKSLFILMLFCAVCDSVLYLSSMCCCLLSQVFLSLRRKTNAL